MNTLIDIDNILNSLHLNLDNSGTTKIIAPTTKNVILTTTDYSMFKTLVPNRDLDHSRVKKLAKLFTKSKYNSNFTPIMITVYGFVIDGQHRLAACILLGIPVSYIIRECPPDVSCEDFMLDLNISSKNWTTNDYVVSNKKSGIIGYDIINKLMVDNKVSYGILADLGIAPSNSTPKKGIPLNINLAYGTRVLMDHFRFVEEFKALFPNQKLSNTQALARSLKNTLRARVKYDVVKQRLDLDKIIRDLKYVTKGLIYPPSSEREFRSLIADAQDYHIPNKNKIGEEIRSINDKMS